jgi:hypothetical protein
MYILTQEEMEEYLKTRSEFETKFETKIEKLCAMVAEKNDYPCPIINTDDGEACDDCPVEDMCTSNYKSYSK